MASIERRRDGHPGWTVRWRDELGKQRKKSFAKKVDADRFRAETEHALNTAAYVDPRAGRIPFQEYAERWRASVPHRANTASRTRSQLNRHVYPVIGHRPLSALRPSELQSLVTGLELSPASVRPVWATVRAVLSSAVRDRLIVRDPAVRIKLPKVPRGAIVPLSVDQVAALAAAMPPRYRALVEVGAGTGLRQGELFGLRVSDVDTGRRELVVDRQVQPGPGGEVEVCPLKNSASYRTVPIGGSVVRAIARHLDRWPAEGTQFLFRDDDGLPLSRPVFNRAVWGPARRAAGLPEVTCHDLRHFYASALIRAGLNPKVVASRLGHSNASMTLNVYSHLWPDDSDRSREAIDALFQTDVPATCPGEEV